jgi:hypothetical protein
MPPIGVLPETAAATPQPAPVALILAPERSWREVRAAVSGLRLQAEFVAAPGVLLARVEAGCPAIVIVDMDLLSRVDDLTRFARSLRPDVHLIGMSWWRSDHERLAEGMDLVLHKPIRRDEWFPALGRLLCSRPLPDSLSRT